MFAPVVETGWETVLQEAKEAGIPVILMDRKVDVTDKSLYVTCVGSDFVEEGQRAGRWLEKDLARRGMDERTVNIVILKGTQGSSSQIGRTIGFSVVAANHGNWNILEQEYADFTSAKGREVMEVFLRKHPDIDVVISQNDDMTFGAIEAIRDSGRTVGIGGDITIISFDAVNTALKMVSRGDINVDIECNPNQGEYISQVIEMLEDGQEVESQYYVEEDVFYHRECDKGIDRAEKLLDGRENTGYAENISGGGREHRQGRAERYDTVGTVRLSVRGGGQ